MSVSNDFGQRSLSEAWVAIIQLDIERKMEALFITVKVCISTPGSRHSAKHCVHYGNSNAAAIRCSALNPKAAQEIGESRWWWFQFFIIVLVGKTTRAWMPAFTCTYREQHVKTSVLHYNSTGHRNTHKDGKKWCGRHGADVFQNVSRGATTWSPLLLVHPPVPSSECLQTCVCFCGICFLPLYRHFFNICAVCRTVTAVLLPFIEGDWCGIWNTFCCGCHALCMA